MHLFCHVWPIFSSVHILHLYFLLTVSIAMVFINCEAIYIWYHTIYECRIEDLVTIWWYSKTITRTISKHCRTTSVDMTVKIRPIKLERFVHWCLWILSWWFSVCDFSGSYTWSRLVCIFLIIIYYYIILYHIHNCLSFNIICNFHNWFKLNNENHNYCTRSNYQISLNIEVTNSLFIPTSRTTNYGLKRTKVIGPKIWNSIPWDIRKINSNGGFKKALKCYLLSDING